jgi:hypothetical protein
VAKRSLGGTMDMAEQARTDFTPSKRSKADFSDLAALASVPAAAAAVERHVECASGPAG